MANRRRYSRGSRRNNRQFSHASDTPDSRYDARDLSQRRKDAVRQWLNREVVPTRLTAIGHGATNPVASNDTEDGRHSTAASRCN